MTFRKFALTGLSGLCIVAAVAGHAAEPYETAPRDLIQADATEANCMLEGFDTPDGRVGCFQPVIAVIDANFFEQNAAIVADDDAAE